MRRRERPAVLVLVLVLATAGVLGAEVLAAGGAACVLSPAALAIADKNYPRLDPPVSTTDSDPVLRLNGTLSAYVLGSSLECKTLADFVAAANRNELYANIHTVTHPGGLVRGQVELVGERDGVSTYYVEMSGLKQVLNNTVSPANTPTTATLRLRVDPASDLATWELNVTDVLDMVTSHVHGGNTTSNGPAVALLAPAAPPPAAPAAPLPGGQPPDLPPSPGSARLGASALRFALAAIAGAAWILA